MEVGEHLGKALWVLSVPEFPADAENNYCPRPLVPLLYAGWPVSQARAGRTVGLEDNPVCGEFSAPSTPSRVYGKADCRNLWKLVGQAEGGECYIRAH